MDRTTLAWASAVMIAAVALGAFGAHGLKVRVSSEALQLWKTGTEYHFYHGLGLFGLAAIGARSPKRSKVLARTLFLLGILCFSGSLYLLSLREVLGLKELTPVLGPITPIGGLFFISGWAVLLITALRHNDRDQPQ